MQIAGGRPLLGDDGHLMNGRECPGQVPVETHVECRNVIPDRFLLDWRAIRLMGKPAGGLVGHGRVIFQQRLVRGFDHGAGHGKRPSRHQPVGVRRGIDGVKQFGTAPQS